MTILAELGAYIAANASGMTFTPSVGVNVFAGRRLPDAPDAAVGLIEYVGRSGVPTHRSGGYVAWERPRVQVIARDTQEAGGYSNARLNAEALYIALQKVKNQTLSGVFYLSIDPLQPPFEMGPDAKDRPVYGFNIECKKYLSE